MIVCVDVTAFRLLFQRWRRLRFGGDAGQKTLRLMTRKMRDPLGLYMTAWTWYVYDLESRVGREGVTSTYSKCECECLLVRRLPAMSRNELKGPARLNVASEESLGRMDRLERSGCRDRRGNERDEAKDRVDTRSMHRRSIVPKKQMGEQVTTMASEGRMVVKCWREHVGQCRTVYKLISSCGMRGREARVRQ